MAARSDRLLTSPQQELEYAGVRRSIIYKNPPLIDDDGYEVESGDEAERVEEAAITAAQLNPYATLRLEREFWTRHASCKNH